jgi:hypothetical protein
VLTPSGACLLSSFLSSSSLSSITGMPMRAFSAAATFAFSAARRSTRVSLERCSSRRHTTTHAVIDAPNRNRQQTVTMMGIRFVGLEYGGSGSWSPAAQQRLHAHANITATVHHCHHTGGLAQNSSQASSQPRPQSRPSSRPLRTKSSHEGGGICDKQRGVTAALQP